MRPARSAGRSWSPRRGHPHRSRSQRRSASGSRSFAASRPSPRRGGRSSPSPPRTGSSRPRLSGAAGRRSPACMGTRSAGTAPRFVPPDTDGRHPRPASGSAPRSRAAGRPGAAYSAHGSTPGSQCRSTASSRSMPPRRRPRLCRCRPPRAGRPAPRRLRRVRPRRGSDPNPHRSRSGRRARVAAGPVPGRSR